MSQDTQLTCGLCNHRWTEPQGGSPIVECPNCGQPVRIPEEAELQEIQERGAASKARDERTRVQAVRRRFGKRVIGGVLLAIALAGILLFLDSNRQARKMSDLEQGVGILEREAELSPPRDPESVRLFLVALRLKMSDLHAMSERWVSERRSALLERLGKLIQRVESIRTVRE